MSRKYLNDRWCVRCGKTDPCPYLRDNCGKLINGRKCGKLNVIDVGCGNGRNSEFMKNKGCKVVSVDMANDYGKKTMLGKDPLPAKDGSVDIILSNYVMMFLNQRERAQLIREFKRIASDNCIIMLELYPAKDSFAKTEEDMVEMQKKIFDKLGWAKIRYSKARFIAQKDS